MTNQNNNKPILLQEFHALCPDNICNLTLLNESEKKLQNEGHMMLSGIIQVADEVNHNGRIYPYKTLLREIEVYKKEFVDQGRGCGQLDHPNDSIVALEKVSHCVTRIWNEGNKFYGIIRVLKTPMGQIAESLVNSGIPLGISSRALGSLTRGREGLIVDNDLNLVAFDLVSNSSAPGAYLHLQESRDPTLQKRNKLYFLLNDILKKQ